MSTERVKQHFKDHKEAYIAGGMCLLAGALAGFTGAIMKSVVQQPISPSFAGTADRSIAVVGSKVLNSTFYISANRQGPPSWVVRCLETGAIFTSQRSAAQEMGLAQDELSAHLNGIRDHVRGYRFERICMAA